MKDVLTTSVPESHDTHTQTYSFILYRDKELESGDPWNF